MHIDSFVFGVARVSQAQINTRVEEREFAQAMLQRTKLKHGLGENLMGRIEFDFRTSERFSCAFTLFDNGRITRDLQRGLGHAVFKGHKIFFAAAPHTQLKSIRQRIDNRDAHAMQTARNLVGVLVEFSTGMELGHDDFGRRHALFFVNIDRHAAPVVAHRTRAIAVQNHIDFIAMTCQRFVDGVIDDFVNHVMKA